MKEGREKSGNLGRKGLGFWDWVLIGGFLAGAGILLYPTISDQWNRYRNSRLIAEYGRAVETLSQESYEEIWEEARAYNREHRVNSPAEAFGEAYELSHPYDKILDPFGDGVMGSIEIPKIHVSLGIYHGIGTDVLEEGCGHVEGTSLPIGGEGSHAALAAHRGLPSARLFTDLDQLEEGDRFYLRILDEVLCYEVDQIKVVLPGETGELSIEEGEDYVTLVTCTPYGVNSHRLLVRGKRREYREEEAEELQRAREEEESRAVQAAAAGIGAVVLLLGGMVFVWRKRE